MKQSLQLRVGQSLTMTPQLQQAIRLLQLSTLELQTEIQEILESNPMLEVEEESSSPDPLEDSKQKADDSKDENGNQSETIDGIEVTDLQNDAAAQDVDLNSSQDMPDELPVDSQWDDIYEPTLSNTAAALIDHLLDQLLVTTMSDVDRTIALAIIDGIDEDGYLQESAEDLHAGLVDDLEIDLDEVEAVLHLIQHFDPIGIAARDLKECLLLQMEAFKINELPVLKKARQIVKDHLDLLGNHDYAKLKRYNRITDDELADIIRFIQTLNPKPGGNISLSSTQYVVPDVFVTKTDGRWNVRLNGQTKR